MSVMFLGHRVVRVWMECNWIALCTVFSLVTLIGAPVDCFANGMYYIQTNSFGHRQNAEIAADKLTSDTYKTIVSVGADKKWKVLVGPFRYYADAAAAKEIMHSRDIKNCFIIQHETDTLLSHANTGELTPALCLYLNKSDFEKQTTSTSIEANKVLKVYRSPDAEHALRNAYMAVKANEVLKARSIFEKAIVDNPNNPLASEAALRIAYLDLKSNDRSKDSLRHLTDVCRGINNPEPSIRAEAIGLSARMLLRDGNLLIALQAFREQREFITLNAHKIKDSDRLQNAILLEMAALYFQLALNGKGSLVEAHIFCDLAIKRTPQTAEELTVLRLIKSEILCIMDNYEESELLAQQILSSSNADSTVSLHASYIVAISQLRRDRPHEAIRTLETSLSSRAQEMPRTRMRYHMLELLNTLKATTSGVNSPVTDK